MLKRIKSTLFIICAVMVLTAQTYRTDEKGQQGASGSHNNQGRPQPVQVISKPPVQVSRPPVQEISRPPVRVSKEPSHSNQGQGQEQRRREGSKPVVNRQLPPREINFHPPHQEREAPRVYAVVPSAPVMNNNLFHRQHHKNWQPRYNYFDNEYHFYPYVNIANAVDLSADGESIEFGGNGSIFYYDQGTFYQKVGLTYLAVVPPVGIIVNPIAANARQIIVNGQVFYRYKGVFYVQVAEGYQVVEPVQYPGDDS